MERKHGLTLAVLVIGTILLFVQLGIFVFIYLPTCFFLAVILVIRSWRTKQRIKAGLEKPKPKIKTRPISRSAKTPMVFRVLNVFGILLLIPTTLMIILSFLFPGGILIFALFSPLLLIGIYFLRNRSYRLSLASVILLFSMMSFIGITPLFHISGLNYLSGVAMLKKMRWFFMEGILPLCINLILATASILLFMVTIINKTNIQGARRTAAMGICFLLCLLPIAYTILVPIPPPTLGPSISPSIGGPGPRLNISPGNCTLTQDASGRNVYTIPVEYRYVVYPPHGPGEVPLVINKIQLDYVIYSPPFDFARVEGEGLELVEDGIVIQPHANGTITFTADKPYSWLILYDNCDNTYPLIW